MGRIETFMTRKSDTAMEEKSYSTMLAIKEGIDTVESGNDVDESLLSRS